MAACKHIAWLRVIENKDPKEIAIEETDRLKALVREFPDPDTQKPQLAFFLGTTTKDEALRKIFSRNNIGRRGERGNINLRVDTESLQKDHPIFFADSSPFERSAQKSHVWCHETKTHMAAWHVSPSRSVMDAIYSRLIFLFSDIICIFADDFSTLEAVMLRLIAWVEYNSASSLPLDVRPRVLIIISEDGHFGDKKIEDFQTAVQSSMGRKLLASFSTMKVFRLAGKHLSGILRYQRLSIDIHSQMEEMRLIRQSCRCFFSASHFAAFFSLAVRHTARTLQQEFNFVQASREEYPIQRNYNHYLQMFLENASHLKLSYDVIVSHIASSMVMDAFPPRMHRE